MLGICDAMRYLHKHGILYRDLNPENILLDENYYPWIVCNFGLSRCFSEVLMGSMQLSMTVGVGAPLYMAPELLVDEKERYGFGIDVYAFAMLVMKTDSRFRSQNL